MSVAEKLKSIVCETIDSRSQDLYDLSMSIWARPELLYEEHHAHDVLTSFLEQEGFNVHKKTPLATSFIARYPGDRCGDDGSMPVLKIGIFCEYDALPGIGHACGHNLIAEVGIATAVALKQCLSTNEEIKRKVDIIVFGTPAEEGGFGKVRMLDEGVFDELDICLMSHPTPFEIPAPVWLAAQQFYFTFHGVASHGAAAPWEGVNALDAAVMCYNSISLLRQQIKPSSRIHCIFTEGGEKVNIIPERAQLKLAVRDLTDEGKDELLEKLEECARGAAMATGCTVDIQRELYSFSSLKSNMPMVELYVQNTKSLGVEVTDRTDQISACTDMGNVSKVKPCIHPLFKISTKGANHTRDFTDASGCSSNQVATLNSAKGLAMTAIDVICGGAEMMMRIREDFENN